MTLTELRYIIAVAREKHFCKAAKYCNVSQSTLSLGIKKLEEELGVILFERRHQDISITPIGEKIIIQANQVLNNVQVIKELAQVSHDPLSDPLRLGALHTVGPYLFPELFPVVQDKAPQLRLLVEENYTSELIKKLKRGDIDAAIVSLPFESAGIETQTLYEEPFVILVPASHPLALNDAISMRQLALENVLLLEPQHCFREQVTALNPQCFSPQRNGNGSSCKVLEGSSLETIRFMVAGGVGLAIVPRMSACADRYAQRLITIKHFSDMEPSRKIALAWRKNYSRIEAVSLIAQCIQSCSLGGAKIKMAAPKYSTLPKLSSAH